MDSSTPPEFPIRRFTAILPTMIMAASTVVDFDRKSDVLLTPKVIVTLEPPIGPARPLPFEDCIKTTAIRIMEDRISNTIISVIMVANLRPPGQSYKSVQADCPPGNFPEILCRASVNNRSCIYP